ncbi:Transmembrane and TPR repeat-containing protein 2 [Mizuhopecten yessoensis]|uniref:dolichyl-phosphate-mannose--protein mannosyltransferase n=1 Tax=Mizuhopecten yessoensis TaxID=6573 RepID=A0A210QJQ6_MIZYE|nr:Transmembrane and TPR repeat-containing protein 2 [Mizuhopecten yessoensis]
MKDPYLDPVRAIQKNQDLRPETPILNVIYDDFWGTPLTHSGSHKSYRPLCVLSFRLNYFLGELNPWGYHLGNVLLHVVVTAVFTHFARIFLRHTVPTIAAGLLFACHPIHVEAVAGVVGRADVGACLFFLLAILAYIKYVHQREVGNGGEKYVWFGLVAVLTTASMLTKEQGVMVIAVCASYDLFIHHKVTLQDIITFKWVKRKDILEGIVLLVLVGVSLITFRLVFMGNKPPEFAPSDNPASDSESLLTRTLTYLLLPSLNLWILLCPRVLSFDWSMDAIPLVESAWDVRNVYSIVFYFLLFYKSYLLICDLHNNSNKSTIGKIFQPYMNGNGLTHHTHSNSQNNNHHHHNKNVLSLKSSKLLSSSRRPSNSSTDSEDEQTTGVRIYRSQDICVMAFALMVFPFVPATNLFFYVGFVIAERVLYIPSMGFCLLVAHGGYVVYKKLQRNSVAQKVFAAAFVALVALFCGKTVIRNRVWQTEENLYRSGVSVNPAKAWGNLANVLNSQGKVGEAETAYRNALIHRSNMADTHYNLGILLQDQKRYEEAIESYKRAIQCRPKLSMAHLNLAIIYALQSRYEEAEKVYMHCADLDTSGLKDPRLHENTKISALYNLGRLYAEMDRNQDSIAMYKEALKRRPSYYQPQSIYNMMGEVYLKLTQFDEAEYWYKEALRVKTDHIPAHLTMAKLFQKKNMVQVAEEWYQKARDIDAGDLSVQHHYAQFMAETGRLEEAAQMYLAAVERAPNDFEVVFNAANILRQIQDNSRSEDLYRRAAHLKPHVATAHMNLGAMLHLNGKLAEAEHSYLEALRLKPDDTTTKQNLVKLRNLMKKDTSNGKAKR